MNRIFKPKKIVRTIPGQFEYSISNFVGSGTQGEVYRVRRKEECLALKWYFPNYLRQDGGLRKRLERAIDMKSPTDKFLWPLSLVSAREKKDEFGYIMPFKEAHFRGIVDLMKRRTEPSFQVLAITGFELVHNYYLLHAKGLCYRDISINNVFFDPHTGDIRISDNDNVDVNGQPGPISGTPRFMAPELVMGKALPSRETDLFSLAVLLFYLLMIHHPLEGKKESEIHSLDLPAMRDLYGKKAVFIFDPENDSNRPIAGYQNNAIVFWEIYPKFLKNRFITAFTRGLHNQDERVAETVWRKDFARLHDSIIYCAACGAENFYDSDLKQASSGKSTTCWSCNEAIHLPPYIEVGKRIVMLNYNSKLFSHHIDRPRVYNFSRPLAEVTQHPQNPAQWGLKNSSKTKWVCIATDNSMPFDVMPGQSVPLSKGLKINFGTTSGIIHY